MTLNFFMEIPVQLNPARGKTSLLYAKRNTALLTGWTTSTRIAVARNEISSLSRLRVLLRLQLFRQLELAVRFFIPPQLPVGLPEQMVRHRIVWIHRERPLQRAHCQRG